jgi:hypothetical protein
MVDYPSCWTASGNALHHLENHILQPVAFCDTPERAAMLVRAIHMMLRLEQHDAAANATRATVLGERHHALMHGFGRGDFHDGHLRDAILEIEVELTRIGHPLPERETYQASLPSEA